jgi:hypothetical protein
MVEVVNMVVLVITMCFSSAQCYIIKLQHGDLKVQSIADRSIERSSTGKQLATRLDSVPDELEKNTRTEMY